MSRAPGAEHFCPQVDSRDTGEGFNHRSPERRREGSRGREKSQSEPERGGRARSYSEQKAAVRERQVPSNRDGWQKDSTLKRRKGR